MRITKKSLSAAILTGSALLLTAGLACAQAVVNLTALRQSTTAPDGNIIPMWGWLCGTDAAGVVTPGGTGTAAATGGATCTQTNGTPQAVGTAGPSAVWQPPLIVVPYTSAVGVSTTALTINLTNKLPVPTSLTIVGQLPNAADANGAGHPARESGRPQHTPQTATTWTAVVPSGGWTPPTQGARAQSFVQEAAASTGVITYTWTALQPGTYLIESGSYPSIQGPMGLYGVLVVTAPPAGGAVALGLAGVAYPSPTGATNAGGVPYDADAVLLLSEIDAVQNQAADTAVQTAGFSPFNTWTPDCSPSGTHPNTCYPAAVNFTPTYYLINGHSFDRTNPGLSAVNVGTTDTTGTVLLRFVNAGLRMHMPQVSGLQMTLIGEDGHLQPDVAVALTKGTNPAGVNPAAPCPSGNAPINLGTGFGACPKVQNDWFMAAGKTLDVAVQPAGAAGGSYTSARYPAFSRDLALSTNNERDGGMQAYVLINGGLASTSASGIVTYANVDLSGVTLTAQANPDNFILPANSTAPFTFNVLANDVGVTNALAVPGSGATSCPTQAPGQTNCLYLNGMYVYVPAAANAPMSFSYCGNGLASGPTCAAVSIAAATLGSAPTATAMTFTSQVSTLLNVSQPGVLATAHDPSGYRVYASTVGTTGAATGPGSQPQNPVVSVAAPANIVEGSIAANCSAGGTATVTLQSNGAFTATHAPAAAESCTFSYYVVNAQGTVSGTIAAPAAVTVTLNFPAPSNLSVQVVDATPGSTLPPITDYKWIIEQDLTFKMDPACQVNNGATGTIPTGSDGRPCWTASGNANGVPPTLATNFATNYMPVIASGCTGPQSCERGQSVYNPATGTHVLAACNHGVCLPNPAGTGLPQSLPSDVQLNAFEPDGVTPARYYISILPGDIGNPFNTAFPGPVTSDCQLLSASSPTTATGQQVTSCGHTITGAPVPSLPVGACSGVGTAATCNYASAAYTGPGSSVANPLRISAEPNPLLTATLTVFVFEDDAPLNGEHDVGGNNNEPGLGDFQVEVWDEMGQAGDFTGQMTYDIFNMPLSNSLNGTIDPLTGRNACPVAATAPDNAGNPNQVAAGMIIVCPQFEDDGVTPSPLAGNAVVRNLMPGRFGVIVHPSAAREAAGEVWYQTNTLDGTHFLDSFVKVGEPAYFQEYGPGGWHVFMGMANPAVINGRKAAFCNGPPAVSCGNTIKGQVSNMHESRAPDETLYGSGVFPQGNPANYAAFAHTTCWASLGDPDGLTFAFVNCDANGNYEFDGIPDGNWALTVGDQWNDLIIDGSSKPLNVCTGATCTVKTPQPFMVDSPTFSWQTHIWTSAFMDLNGNGIQDDPAEAGLLQVPMRIRFRNGQFNNTGFTDISGHVRFNETFPLFSWYVVESDDTRFKNTGVHVVYDFGGQLDGPSGTNCLDATSGGSSNQANSASNPCGNGGGAYPGLINSVEPAAVALPASLRFPGSYYCSSADCSERAGIAGFPNNATPGPSGFPTAASGSGGSTGRIDPGTVLTEGLQGFLSQTEILDWGKLPYLPGENGGIRGHVVYSSTRPFDDPTILFQNLWEPLVPGVTINLYQETTQPDGTVGLTLIDTTQTSSWDQYAQGFRSPGVPNMNCPGQSTADPFFKYTLAGAPTFLHPSQQLPGLGGTVGVGAGNTNGLYKCYDGMHNFNQVQPAPYDGLYVFPSATCAAAAGAAFTYNGQQYHCATVANANYGQPASPAVVLPTGKYVVEVVVPPGYELTKEEDKNILIGDAFVGSTVINNQFVGLGNIYIVPDQASINQNNINGVYNPAMYSNQTNPTYVGPFTGNTTACTGVNTPPGCTNTPASPYNPDGSSAGNFSQPTGTMGRDQFTGFGPGGLITLNSPCVGEVRIVPDYMSISPESGQVAPFAGASRPLCDRKEVVLDDQMQAQAEFFVWTKTPAATRFTGFILDDFSSEFNQASPTFGEKFAVPNLPVSIKDFNGREVARTYSDQWGLFNGLMFSTFDVNPPNPTGYSPGMYVTEMNSPGPIVAPVCITPPSPIAQGFPLGCVVAQSPAGTPPLMVTDPYFNPNYSTFDYENPFMPASTTYLDTPVVPVAAFAEGYNAPDCGYPDATPAIQSVVAVNADGSDTIPANTASATTSSGVGPWVSATGHQLRITAVGDQIVPNYAYSGPAATTSPFNQRTVTRHYGFGTAHGTVTIGGVIAPLVPGGWTDSTITVTVPANMPLCTANPMYYQSSNPTYTNQATGANATARCGELVVTTAAGQRSVDGVTVTVGGTTPSYVSGEHVNANTFGNTFPNSLQAAIDAASPGDMIVVGPGTYAEQLLLWKPVRLQGVGAPATIINANAHPSGKLDPWRREVDCLFGLGLNGQRIGAPDPVKGTPNVYDTTGTYSCGFSSVTSTTFNGQPYAVLNQAAVDPIMLEPVIGWDATLNGNVSELLQEPTLMGAYEGAAITALAKGLENYEFNTGGTVCSAEGNGGCVTLNNCAGYVWTDTTTHAVSCNTSPTPPAGTTSAPGDCNPSSVFYTGNFLCNPSRIDGFTLTNSSQGGGALFVHGWNHYLEISNNRITNNAGTLTGGITLGQPEVPDPTTVTNADGSIDALPLQLDAHVSMHHNGVTFNSSYGDELNSSTPAAAGGITVNTGSDFYSFQRNFVCGNLSSGDGGGMTHFGLSSFANISHNTFLYNQSTNPTLTTNGGGLIIEGNAPDGTFAETSRIDVDVGPGLSEGAGQGIIVNGNLLMGNTAESGEGGGLRLQNINGNDILNNPGTIAGANAHWYRISVTNNVIVNNVAGWEGGGVSIQDAVAVDFRNNTVASNESTATAGVLFDTLGAPLANTPPQGTCTTTSPAGCNPVSGSTFMPAGLVTHAHSSLLAPAFTDPTVECPNAAAAGYTRGTSAAQPSSCTQVSLPVVANDIVFGNRAFYMTSVGSPAVVVLTPALSQTGTGYGITNGVVSSGSGMCPSGAQYWDMGVYGDTSVSGGNPGGFRLNPSYSIYTNNVSYPGAGNIAAASSGANLFASMYCNGSRVPPEIAPTLCSTHETPGCTYQGAVGITTPPGVPDNNPFYAPFTLTPAATVDEGNNWINMYYGPLTNVNPTVARGAAGYATALGDYAPFGTSSPAYNAVPSSVPHPARDFYGNLRPEGGGDGFFDIGAIELGSGATPHAALTTITPNSGLRGTSVNVVIDGFNLQGSTGVAVSGGGITVSNIAVVGTTSVTATFTISATAALTARNVTVLNPAGNATLGGAFMVTGHTLTSITPNSGLRGTTNLVVNLVGTNLTGASGMGGLGGGVTLAAGSFVVNSSTSITARLNISATATLGVRNLSVLFPVGAGTNTVPFTVGPFLRSITPNSGVRGTSGIAVTLTGVGLTNTTAVTVTGGNGNVTVTGFSVISDTQVNATLNIASAALFGGRAVRVTVTPPGGAAQTSNTVVFTVKGGTFGFSGPVLTSTPATTATKNGTITVTNTTTGANAAPITLTAAPNLVQEVPASPPAALKFSITGGTCVSGTVLNPGGSCTITVQYAPGGVTTTASAYVLLPNTGAAFNPASSPHFNAD
jgi:hypothetical protein